jgi:hypothetical protein
MHGSECKKNALIHANTQVLKDKSLKERTRHYIIYVRYRTV